jgi:hypothetical protein
MGKLFSRTGAVAALSAVSLAAGGTMAVSAAAATKHVTGSAASGKRGKTGKTGPRGPQGAPGANGTNGTNGAPGPQGAAGAQGAAGSAGAQGAPGSAANTGGVSFQNFTKSLAGSASESVTIGQFTVAENAVVGVCTNVVLTDNSSFSYYDSYMPDSNGDPGQNPTLELANATSAAVFSNTMDSFSAALTNGTSSISGTVMNISESNNTCLTVGYVAGA